MKYQFLPLFLKKIYLFYLAASGLSCSMQHLLLQKCTGFRSLWFSCGTLRAYLLQGMREVSFPTRDGTLDPCTGFLTIGPPGKSPNFCVCVCVCVCVSHSILSYSATPWTTAHQTPLSMGFSRQEYWRG